jgi:hypothetical protein
MALLTCLLRKEGFRWSIEAEAVFRTLQRALTSHRSRNYQTSPRTLLLSATPPALVWVGCCTKAEGQSHSSVANSSRTTPSSLPTNVSSLGSFKPCATGACIFGAAPLSFERITAASNSYWINACPRYPNISGQVNLLASISRLSTSRA